MKRYSILTVTIMLSVLLSLSSCELVGDIFKAGVWVGVLIVVGIIALILFLLKKIF